MIRRILFWLGIFALVTFFFVGWGAMVIWLYMFHGLLWVALAFGVVAACITHLLNTHFRGDEPVELYGAPESWIDR
jgi:hypothetical protein